MNRNKIASIIMLVAMLSSIPLGMTQAAAGSSVLVTGTVQSIVIETDPVTTITTVVVYFVDDTGLGQSARISFETAITMQLVVPNPESISQLISIPDPIDPLVVLYSGTVDALAFVNDPVTLVTTLDVTITDGAAVTQVVKLDLETALLLGLIIPNAAMLGTPIALDPLVILESGTYSQKITLLFSFFGPSLVLTPDQLAAYEGEGVGFGVLAEALWITYRLGGDAALFDQILAAKTSGDFSAIVLPDGSTPANWGQLRKAAILNPHDNLGRIVSGKADPLTSPGVVPPTSSADADDDHGKSDEEHGKAPDKDKKK